MNKVKTNIGKRAAEATNQALTEFNIQENIKNMPYTIKDSGKRATFSTGMQRDSAEKIRYDLIPTWMLTRFAEHLTKGSHKYKPRNWERASTPQELDRFIQSFWRHWMQYLDGENSEDHYSAIIFNLCGIELVRQRLGKDWQKQLEEFRMKEGDL